MPNFNYKSVWQDQTNTVGTSIVGSLPNITGTFGKTQTINNDSFATGAFTLVNQGVQGDANAGLTSVFSWTFDASRSSQTYGRYQNELVIPEANNINFCIRY